jgi:inner membrane protein
MSSLIGHSLAAIAINMAMPKANNPAARDQTPSRQKRWGDLLWLGWLITVACAPDLDYVIPSLHPSAHGGMRITHAIISCLILPIASILVIVVGSWRSHRNNLALRSPPELKPHICKKAVQLLGAGLSHPLMDLLVGVTPLPLFFPLSENLFKLPFGILPSAGKIDLTNYYLYRNLGIELGILLPLLWTLWLLVYPVASSSDRSINQSNSAKLIRNKWIAILPLSISSLFAIWSFTLNR